MLKCMRKIVNYDINRLILYLCFLAIGFDGFYFYGFSFAIKPFMLIIMVGILIILKKRYISDVENSEKLMMLFFCVYALSCVRFGNLNGGFRYIAGSILVLLLYFSLREILNCYTIYDIEEVMANCGIIVCVCSLFMYLIGLRAVDFNLAMQNRMRVGGILFERGVPRLFGTPNQDPNFAAMMFMLYFFYFLYNLNKIKNYLGLCLSSLCIILTFSRTALFAIVVALISRKLFCRHFKFEFKIGRRQIKQLFIILFILMLLFVSLIEKNIVFNLLSVIIRRIKSISSDGGSGRFELWKYGLRGWLEKPIWGHGGNQVKKYMELTYGIQKELHNTWLEVLFESGIIGMLCLISCISTIGKKTIELLRSKREYIFVTFVGVIIMLTSVSGLFNENNYLLFALIYRYSREDKSLHSNEG